MVSLGSGFCLPTRGGGSRGPSAPGQKSRQAQFSGKAGRHYPPGGGSGGGPAKEKLTPIFSQGTNFLSFFTFFGPHGSFLGPNGGIFGFGRLRRPDFNLFGAFGAIKFSARRLRRRANFSPAGAGRHWAPHHPPRGGGGTFYPNFPKIQKKQAAPPGGWDSHLAIACFEHIKPI